MSDDPSSVRPPDAGETAHQFFIIQEVLRSPVIARFYSDMLINSPTTITAARDRQKISKSTAYKYADTLADLDVAEELDAYEDGSSLWRADSVSGTWAGETTIDIGPVLVAAYGATSVNDDLELFVDRHGKAALAPAVTATLGYLAGETTRRGIADDLGVPAVEAIAVTQVIEQIIVVVRDHDPTLNDISFDVEVHERAFEQAPYQRANE